jgi:hypothetical protein
MEVLQLHIFRVEEGLGNACLLQSPFLGVWVIAIVGLTTAKWFASCQPSSC